MFRTLIAGIVISASLAACSTPAQTPAPAVAARACVPREASRIPPAGCQSGPGRAYSQTDLRDSGRPEVADALRSLDPSITVHH